MTKVLEWKCWTDLHIEAMRCANTEFRRSHSSPILHLNRWLPKSSWEELHVYVDGKRSCRGAFTLILSQWWTLKWKTNILDMKFEPLKKLQTPVPEHEWSLSLSDVKKCLCTCVCVWFDFPSAICCLHIWTKWKQWATKCTQQVSTLPPSNNIYYNN